MAQVLLRGGPMDGFVTKESDRQFIVFGVGDVKGPDPAGYIEIHYARTDEIEAGLPVWRYVEPGGQSAVAS